MESKIEFKPENYGKIIELLNAKLSRGPGTGRALVGHSVSLLLKHREDCIVEADEFLGEVETQVITTGARIIMKEGSPVPESLSERNGSQETHLEMLIIHTLDRRSGEFHRVCRLDPRQVDWAVENGNTVSFVEGTSGWARTVVYFHPAEELTAEKEAFAFLSTAMKAKENARVLLVSDNNCWRLERFLKHLVSEGVVDALANIDDLIMRSKVDGTLHTDKGTVLLSPEGDAPFDAVAVLCGKKRAETMGRMPEPGNTRYFTWED